MSVQELLLGALEDLIEDDFKTFKWYLSQENVEGCKSIKKAQLENVNRPDTVTKMKDSYGLELAVSVTIMVLKKMGKNGNAEELKTEYEATGRRVATGSAAVCAAAPAAAPSGGLTAQGGSVIIAPSVTGGTSGTWNITVNK